MPLSSVAKLAREGRGEGGGEGGGRGRGCEVKTYIIISPHSLPEEANYQEALNTVTVSCRTVAKH